MGDTGANMAAWGGLYVGGGGAPATTEATVVTAAAAGGGSGSVSSPTSGGSGGSPTRAQQSGVGRVEGGRVGKPARRRSRASRRAPVTLLNTDTSNFRAMVQQFTGIPSGPYGPGGGPVISFGAAGGGGGGEYGGAQLVRPSPTSAVMSFDHLTAAHAHAHHRPTATTSLQSQLFRPQHHQQYGGDVGYGMAPSSFLHGGFESSSAEDRLLLQSMMQAAQTTMPAARPASTTNNGNGYHFG